MALHVPSQHAGLSGHRWLRDTLIVAAVIVLTVLVVAGSMLLRETMQAGTSANDPPAVERVVGIQGVMGGHHPNLTIERRAE